MNVTVHVKPGYRGECARCMAASAKHKVWFKYAEPLDLRHLGGSIVAGIWQYVCDGCLKPDDKIGQD